MIVATSVLVGGPEAGVVICRRYAPLAPIRPWPRHAGRARRGHRACHRAPPAEGDGARELRGARPGAGRQLRGDRRAGRAGIPVRAPGRRSVMTC